MRCTFFWKALSHFQLNSFYTHWQQFRSRSSAEQPQSDEYVAQCKSKVAWLQNCGVFWKTNRRLWSIWMRRTSTVKYQIASFLLTHTAIVTEFPRFLDVDFRRLIKADYVHQYPKTSDIGTFMSKYGNRLIPLVLYNKMEIQESTDAFLKVLVVCAKLMPRIQQAKSELNTTLQQLVILLKVNTNLEKLVKNKPKHLKQPFLVCPRT